MGPQADGLAYVYVEDFPDGDTSSAAGACDGQGHKAPPESCQGVSPGSPAPALGAARVRYTAAQLRSTLLLMGCKPRVAHKVA